MKPFTRTADVLGVRFHALTREAAATAVVDLAAGGGQHYVVKPYSEFMPPACRDRKIRDTLNGASLCLADGMGIIWAANYLQGRRGPLPALVSLPFSLARMLLSRESVREPLPQAMRGVDFTWEMLSHLADAGLSVFLLGGTRAEAEGAAAAMARRLPTLKIAGVHQGHFKTKGPENETVLQTINQAAPDVLLVAMGFPRQENWIVQNLARTPAKVAVAEGGSFSFISGLTPRAPGWMRRASLEWLYRLLRQPRRLRRQLALPEFAWLVLRERMSRRAAPPSGTGG
jgi:N-acetylglucosaminyldiphosphoundecaprenol N-acetyl-beta-D-mannosaminyltransferase